MTGSTVTVYTADEVAQKLQCSRESVYRWARKRLIGDGPLPGSRVYRFTDQHIEDFVSGKTKTAAAAPKSKRHPKYAAK